MASTCTSVSCHFLHHLRLGIVLPRRDDPDDFIEVQIGNEKPFKHLQPVGNLPQPILACGV